MKKIGLALIGVGTVGAAFLKNFGALREAARTRAGVELTLSALCDRDASKRELADSVFTDDYHTAVSRGDIVVEAAGGTDAPFDMMKAAMDSGKPYVTANKAMLAEKGHPFLNAGSGRMIGYEAAVGGGMPLIAGLRDIALREEILRVDAVLNGTANYILTMMRRGKTFYAALAEAREKGFAEADASLDTDGTDTAHKISLIAYTATGILPAWGSFPVSGIPDGYIPPEHGRDRLAGRFSAEAGVLGVGLELYFEESLLHNTECEYNGAEVLSAKTGKTFFYGPGAGGMPTSMSLCSDVMRFLTEMGR